MAADPLHIPAVGTEAKRWVPSQAGYFSRAELRRQTGTYEATLPAAISDWEPRLSGELTADIEDAARALVGFDSHVGRRLGSDDPTIGPMASILLRAESASSSQIENLTTSARQLALAEIGESEKRNAVTVVGNVRAMEAALRLSSSIDVAAILDMHRELLRGHSPRLERWAGRFREELVWIGRGDAGPLGAEFIAPEARRVPAAIDDLIKFAARDDLPVLVQVGVAHAQFETIHPFVDGNGRSGRALAQAMIRNKGLVNHATVPISAGLLLDTDGYFDALSAFRAGDAGPIVRKFTAAARYAAVSGRQLVDDLAAQLDESRRSLEGVRSHAAVWAILPKLIGQPVINARYLKAELGLDPSTTQRSLDLLVARGILAERTGLRRNRVWQHEGILQVLDDYAAANRRPGGTGFD